MTRIYRAVLDAYPREACRIYINEMHVPEYHQGHEVNAVGLTRGCVAVLKPQWKPEGWGPDGWGVDRPFGWPTTNRVYLSRSSAEKRVRLLRSYGAEAHVEEAEPAWEPVEQANARRGRARRQARIDKLRAEIARLETA